MSYEFKNKVILITGAAAGIGERIVRFLLQEDVKHVAVLDVAVDAGIALQNELNTKYGANKVKFFKCDVTNDDQLFGAFAAVKKDQGYIDVVINNAGIMNDTPKVYKKQIEVNVTALVTSTLKAIEYMRKDQGGKGGAVINMSSVAGIMKDPCMPIYWATKTAVIQFSNCIGHSAYYAKTGVRVLSVCFGATNTSLLSKEKFGCNDPANDAVVEQMIQDFPVQRPESAARGVLDAFKKGDSSSIWLITSDKPALDITDKFNAVYENVKDLIIPS